MTAPLSAAVVLGFVLGLQHAADPDHLVAVATIVTRERRVAAGALIGAAWGIGHMVTLGLAGGVMIALGIAVPPTLATALESAVAAMLVLLGAWRLREALRELRGGVPTSAGDHDHGGRAALHRHPQLHVHPARSVASAVLYLAVFGLGTIAGMAALTSVMAVPVALALRLRRARTALGLAAGAASMVFGVWYGVRLF